MSKLLKLVLPLVSETFTLKNTFNNKGFIDACDYDINYPYKEDCIFLIYDGLYMATEGKSLHNSFKEMPTFKDWRKSWINGKYVHIYTFAIINIEAKYITREKTPDINSDKNLFRILRFWKGDVDILKHVILKEKWNKSKTSSVPEEDYHNKLGEELDL